MNFLNRGGNMDIYIASHGDFSKGCLSTLKMILGEEYTEKIKTYSLKEGENPNDFTDKFFEQINNETQYVVFTDILGGSVYNSFSKKNHLTNVHVIAGTNINILLEFLLSNEKDLQLRLEQSASNARKGIIINENKLTSSEEEEF